MRTEGCEVRRRRSARPVEGVAKGVPQDRVYSFPRLGALLGLQPGGSVRGERANLKGLVIGCIEAKFCSEVRSAENEYENGNWKKENKNDTT